MCRDHGWPEARNCFLEAGITRQLPLPILQEVTPGVWRGTNEVEYVECDAEQVVETLATLAESFPQLTLGQVWVQWWEEVLCPRSLVTEHEAFLLGVEAELREYHIPPYLTGTIEWPQKLREALAAIREGRADHEQERIETMRREAKTAGS